jgi:hypothetical protein
MGIDPTITLVRGKSKSVPVDKAGGTVLSRKLEQKNRFHWMGVGVRSVAVVFCQKVYRGALVGGVKNDEGIWSADKMRAWAAQEKNREVVVETRWRDEKMTLEQYFTPFETSKALRDYMIANKVSILVEGWNKDYWRDNEHCFDVNPYTLKQLGFAKALDPYSAFQELSMWIGGVLGGTSPETVKIVDDKVLIENHGFDNRFSFRGPRIA